MDNLELDTGLSEREKRVLLILEREWSLRLFQQLHQNCAYEDEWRRASGGCICEFCRLPYRQHYDDLEHPLVGDGFDQRLCGGEVVHL